MIWVITSGNCSAYFLTFKYFYVYMEAIGKVRFKNILPLKAYMEFYLVYSNDKYVEQLQLMCRFTQLNSMLMVYFSLNRHVDLQNYDAYFKNSTIKLSVNVQSRPIFFNGTHLGCCNVFFYHGNEHTGKYIIQLME